MLLSDLEQEVKKDHKVIVKFYADWCQPCKMLTPVMKTIQADMVSRGEKITLIQVNIDQSPQIVKYYDMKSIPFVVKFVDGVFVDAFAGVKDDEFLEKFMSADTALETSTNVVRRQHVGM